jgi:hypothetical protein
MDMDHLITIGESAVAAKFVGIFVDSGVRWLKTFYANHHPKAVEKAHRNAEEFARDLAEEVGRLDQSGAVPPQTIEAAQDDPSFTVLLQRATIASSETESPEKHKLLARLVAERLAVGSETTLAVASARACDVIAGATGRQLRILGFQTVLRYVRPSVPDLPSNDAYFDFLYPWLQKYLGPYMGLEFTTLDISHLEFLSCTRTQVHPPSLVQILATGGRVLEPERFGKSEVGQKVISLWDAGLSHVILTSVGQLVGVNVTDILTGSRTVFREEWES